MTVDIKSILSTLKGKIADLAKSTVSNYVKQATKDGEQLLILIKDDLARWSQELADGRITIRDFETLVIGDKDLAEMSALTQAGLALARIDQFRGSLFNLIIDTVLGILKI